MPDLCRPRSIYGAIKHFEHFTNFSWATTLKWKNKHLSHDCTSHYANLCFLASSDPEIFPPPPSQRFLSLSSPRWEKFKCEEETRVREASNNSWMKTTSVCFEFSVNKPFFPWFQFPHALQPLLLCDSCVSFWQRLRASCQLVVWFEPEDKKNI